MLPECSVDGCCHLVHRKRARFCTQHKPPCVATVLSLGGESMTLKAWAERIGIKADVLRTRLVKCGWSVERALTTPRISPNEKHLHRKPRGGGAQLADGPLGPAGVHRAKNTEIGSFGTG